MQSRPVCLQFVATGFHLPDCPDCAGGPPEPIALEEEQDAPTQSVVATRWGEEDEDEEELGEQLRDCKCCGGEFRDCGGKECRNFGCCKCLVLLRKGLPINLELY